MKRKLFNLVLMLALVAGVLSSPLLLVSPVPAAASLSPSVDLPGRIAPGPLPVVTKASLAQPADPEPPGGPADVSAVTVGAPLAPLSFDGSLWSLARLGPRPEKTPRVIPAPRERYGKAYEPTPNLPQPLDPGRQTWHGEAPMPAPSLNFPGITNLDNENVAGGMIVPPDSDGDVGPNHYIQTVNVVNRVYFKDGTPASPVFQLSQLWAAVNPSDPCAQDDNGDPIGLYDPMADRWLVSQFYFSRDLSSNPVPPYYECIAISKTPDPVNGGWWLYTILAHPTDFWDYPKVGVWPDAYYVTANMFPSAGPPYVRVIALERAVMLAGQPARQVTFDVFDGFSLLPANVRGNSPPPGSPNYLLEARPPNGLRLYRFAVDWDDPGSSTLTSTDLAVNSWTTACSGNRQCVPQLGTTNRLDALSSRLMQPLHYRRIVDGGTEIESLWANHTVQGSAGQTAVRWYELRDPGGSPTVYQQGTYEPDATYRWTGSLATDQDGNMALGYSASSSTIYPHIRYAGRLFTDTLGVLAQDEHTLVAGTTYQKAWSDLSDPRWGDYSAMSVDPLDDCTFWYTNQYYQADPGRSYEHYNWRMRIGAFRFPTCDPLPAPGWITGTIFDAGTLTPIGSAPIAAVNQDGTRAYAGSTDASGIYTLTAQSGTYTVTAGPVLDYPANSVTGVVVSSGAVTRVDIGLVFPLTWAKDGPDTAGTGEVISYTLVVEGPGPLSGTVMMTDVLPAGVAFAGGLTATFGTAWYDGVDNAVYWHNAPMLLEPASPAPAPAAGRHPIELKLGAVTVAQPRESAPLAPDAAVSLVLDDGSAETNLGVTSGPGGVSFQFIWLNRFTPDPAVFPLTLQQIQVFFADGDQGASPGDAIDLAVYQDGDANPANGATWLATVNATVEAADGATWSVYNLDPALTISGPGDVLIGVINRYVNSGITPSNYPAALDESASQRRSWVGWWDAGDPPDPALLPPAGTFTLVDDLGLPGNWMIRGYGQSSAASSAISITFNVTVTAAIGDVVTNVAELYANGRNLSAETTFEVQRPEVAWEKEIWISSDGPYAPADSPFRGLLTTDTVTIVDRVWVTYTSGITFSLAEEWGESLTLTQFDMTGGSFTADTGMATWDVGGGMPSTWYVLTKTIELISGTWTAGAITESLTVEHALPQPEDIVLQFRRFRFEIYLPLALKND
jgi:uncharacterized repeat protein (TIGR01451 family)